jgi:hypothetical protein
MHKPLPSQQSLQELFNYAQHTGIFTYKIKPNFRFKVGSVAGTVKKAGKSAGYCFIKIDGSLYQASRLAWMYVHGQDPGDLTVDHIDRNPSNNAITNLRLATLSQQSFNRLVSNSSGFRGVTYNKHNGKYIACLHFRKAAIVTTKQFDTAEEASEYYEQLRQKHGGQFAIRE